MLWPYSPRIHTKAARASGSTMSCAMSSCFSDEATRTNASMRLQIRNQLTQVPLGHRLIADNNALSVMLEQQIGRICTGRCTSGEMAEMEEREASAMAG